MAERARRPVWTGRTGPLASRLCAGVMGIVNLTPDSFFDGGSHDSPEAGLAFARRLVQDGADMLDLGGESSRPGASPVTTQRPMTWRSRPLPPQSTRTPQILWNMAALPLC